MYDFSSQNRYNTDCLKFDFTLERGHKSNCLSYWVADMDFKTAPEILDAIHLRTDHGIFGYTNIKPHYFEAVAGWIKTAHNYNVKREWLVETPGVVYALATAIKALTEPKDGVIFLSPVYYPFSMAVKNAGRRLVSSSLKWQKNSGGDGRFHIDFEDFEHQVKTQKVKLFLFCNPHNPGGVCWSKDELSRLAEICLKYKVIVFSDEIHSDFIWSGNKHTVFASLSPEIEDITVTATAPSKTFNLAGLQVSNIFISNKKLREKFKKEKYNTGYDEPNVLGLTACEAAYTKGKPWLNECKAFLESNLEFAADFINQNGKGLIHAAKPQATYLLWVDCSGLPFDDQEQNRRITQANLWLDPGNIFGHEGENFQRINVATSREYLEKGLKAFIHALIG